MFDFLMSPIMAWLGITSPVVLLLILIIVILIIKD